MDLRLKGTQKEIIAFIIELEIELDSGIYTLIYCSRCIWHLISIHYQVIMLFKHLIKNNINQKNY